MVKRSRKYMSRFKTTTKEGLREYQRNLMRLKLNISPSRFGVRGPKPKVVYVKDLLDELRQIKVRRGR